jgi:outer membrane murein-binding lipoprotein Lpp
MNRMLAGLVVTVLSGNHCVAAAITGQAGVVLPAQAPLLVASQQEAAEQLLKRLEQLAGAISRLETQVTQLESRNTQLREQLKAGGTGGAYWIQSGDAKGILNPPGGAAVPGSPVIQEHVLRVQLAERVNELRERANDKK